MSSINERNVDALYEMSRIADNILNTMSWGFTESFRSAKLGKIIYNSEWCRVSLIWEGWDPSNGNIMHIRYGRIHAPSEKNIIKMDGEDLRCWHRIEHPLHFLDKRAPDEVARLDYSHPLVLSFYEDEILEQYSRRQPEWLAEMHLTIWKQYGKRLFELFNLQRPELWHDYQEFLKKVYDIAGRIPEIKPPLDKVC